MQILMLYAQENRKDYSVKLSNALQACNKLIIFVIYEEPVKLSKKLHLIISKTTRINSSKEGKIAFFCSKNKDSTEESDLKFLNFLTKTQIKCQICMLPFPKQKSFTNLKTKRKQPQKHVRSQMAKVNLLFREVESIELYNYFQACMQEKEEKEIVQILHDASSESRTLTTNFLIHNCKINHQNTLEVEVNQKKDRGLQIKNHFVKIRDNQVSKVTQIQLGGKIIKIVDKFTSNQYTPHINSTIKMGNTEIINESSKKTMIESKPKVKANNLNRIMKIRDTKNIFKNIFRLFQSWVEDRAPKEMHLTSQLNGILNDNGKYNNSLIMMLTKNKKLKQAFKTFSQTDGEYYIGESRIHDKQSHLKALRRYSRICVNQQIVQQENQDDMEMEQNTNKRSRAEQRLNGSTDSGSGSGNNGGTSPKDSSGQGKEVQT